MARLRSKTAGLPSLKTQEPPTIALRKQLANTKKYLQFSLIINILQATALIAILLFNR